MQMKRYRFKISPLCSYTYFLYRDSARLQLAPGESTSECAVECAFTDQQTQCVGFIFNLAEGNCSLLTWATFKTPLSYYDYLDGNYVCYERIDN